MKHMRSKNIIKAPLLVGVGLAFAFVVGVTAVTYLSLGVGDQGLSRAIAEIQQAVRDEDFQAVERYVDFDKVALSYVDVFASVVLKGNAESTGDAAVQGVVQSMMPQLRTALEKGLVAAMKNDNFAYDKSMSFATALRDLESGRSTTKGGRVTVTFERGDTVTLVRVGETWRVVGYSMPASEVEKIMANANDFLSKNIEKNGGGEAAQ
jgi:Protein of unknown function (DUF2939)